MDPMATPYFAARFLSHGKSHFTCIATVGQHPVNPCTCPASANFSSVVVAAASWMNFPNLVPVFANPQLGSSIAKLSRALKTSMACLAIPQQLDTRCGLRRYSHLREELSRRL